MVQTPSASYSPVIRNPIVYARFIISRLVFSPGSIQTACAQQIFSISWLFVSNDDRICTCSTSDASRNRTRFKVDCRKIKRFGFEACCCTDGSHSPTKTTSLWDRSAEGKQRFCLWGTEATKGYEVASDLSASHRSKYLQ